jgi:energy-coupling factor transporter ATP-binding protein EcfA2
VVSGTNVRAIDGFLASRDELRPISELQAVWRSRFYHFGALRPGTERSQSLSSPEKLDPTGTNLAGVLHFLATDHRNQFEQIRSLIAEIVPGIGQLQVRTGGNQMRVVFESSAGDLNLKDLGTGVEQLLMTLVVGVTEAPPFTLLIEEPETNLHPAAQRALLGLLQTWASNRLIVAATHSPVMLDWSPAGDRLWHVSKGEDGASAVEAVRADRLPLLESLGVRLSDVLSADRVLVVEGSSDEDVLSVWFPELVLNPRIAVLHGGGGDNARHADQLATWLAGTDRVGLRQVLYICDRDELSTEVLAKLTESPTVYVLQRRELENYLLEPDAVAATLARAVPEGNEAPSAEDVFSAITDAAEELRQKIIVNRIARQIAPPRMLMDHKLRQELARADAELGQVTSAVLDRLMTADALREQIAASWAIAEADVNSHKGAELLEIAPGEEILDAVFMRYARRHYAKRADGPAIAKAMQPPAEIREVLNGFLDRKLDVAG